MRWHPAEIQRYEQETCDHCGSAVDHPNHKPYPSADPFVLDLEPVPGVDMEALDGSV